MNNKSKFRPLALIFGILTLFIFIISFTVFYTTENFSNVCGCNLPLWVIIVAMSSLGLFVGLMSYYIISNSFYKEKKELKNSLIKFLDIFESEDKKILKTIIENNGEITQSSLTNKVGLDKVKISRIISKMESKKIIKKEKVGMTNKIKLSKELIDLFEK
jgi:hypothetical protein